MNTILKEIELVKRKLITQSKKEGIKKNFGQIEIITLKKKYNYKNLINGTPGQKMIASYIDSFENWRISYIGQYFNISLKKHYKTYSIDKDF